MMVMDVARLKARIMDEPRWENNATHPCKLHASAIQRCSSVIRGRVSDR